MNPGPFARQLLRPLPAVPQDLAPLLRLCALECSNQAPLRALLSLIGFSRMSETYLLEQVTSLRASGDLASRVDESLWPLQSLVLIAGLQWVSEEATGGGALLTAELDEPMIWASLRRYWRRSACLKDQRGSLLLQSVARLDWSSEEIKRVLGDLRAA